MEQKGGINDCSRTGIEMPVKHMVLAGRGTLALRLLTMLAIFLSPAIPVAAQPVDKADLLISPKSAGSVKLSKVVVNIRRGDRIGYEKSSGICLIPHEVLWRTGQVEIEDRDLEAIFRDQVERAGFRAPGGVEELFESNDDDAVDFLVGAAIDRIDMNVCYPRTEDPEKSRGTASIDVEWQIYSQLERKIVGRLKITGVANRPETDGGGRFGVVKDAFADAVRQLVQSPQFTNVIAKPGADLSVARSAPVGLGGAGGSIFPEHGHQGHRFGPARLQRI